MKAIDFDIYRNTLNNIQGISYTGQVTQVIGLTIESLGPSVQIGEVCLLNNYNRTRTIKAEVVGFKNDRVLLMPLGDVQGIGPGSLVESTHSSLKVSVGEGLVGRILDGLGNPMDGKGPILDPKWVPIDNSPPSPLDRQRITQPLTLE